MVADVGPVEAGDDQPVLGNAELDEDVGARALVGGGGQRQPRHLAMLVEQGQQQPIVGPEIMAPFGNAMRLVDREQGDVGFLQQPLERLGRRPLGRDVEQVELAVAQRVADRARVLAGAGQRGGVNPEALGAAHLVLHQRDQRRDDDRGAVPRQRRQLVAERLARPGRHHRQRVLPGDRPIDHRLLHAAEVGKAETVVEELMHAGHRRSIDWPWPTRKLGGESATCQGRWQ